MPEAAAATDTRILTAAEAILEATDQALAADPTVFVMGEGAADPKGIFGTTAGLVDRWGPDRVMEMPLSENAFTGVAIGAALMGRRPIVIHQRVEFCLLALEQLFGTAAKAHYVSNGRHKVPLTVRLVVGRGWGQGPQHGQSLENLFAAVPGLKVALPADPVDAKGMLLAAVADDNPVVIIEHRWVHYVSGPVPAGPVATDLTGPKTLRRGDDVTVVAASYMAAEALRAAAARANAGVSVDLIDLRLARPLNLEPILESVQRTGRLLTVDLGHKTLGLGAEIVAGVTERAFGALRAAPVRLGTPDHPVPSSRSLAEAFYARADHIATAAGTLAGLPAERVAAVAEALIAERREVPFDVPHPAFKGPF
ncbi:MAG: alpha-ketoacid dehydrogenase subunit beta [Rhodobacterales bacterium]|nr:alpha-ketoacid dehydrogenase subunit beta [Rhodobacterales bacterium]